MADFIKIHEGGTPTILNKDYIEGIIQNEHSCTIYMAFSTPNANDQDYLIPDESCEEVLALIFGEEKENPCKVTVLKDLLNEREISVRTFNVLHRAGYRTFEEVEKLSDRELMELRNLGIHSLEEIKRIKERRKNNG